MRTSQDTRNYELVKNRPPLYKHDYSTHKQQHTHNKRFGQVVVLQLYNLILLEQNVNCFQVEWQVIYMLCLQAYTMPVAYTQASATLWSQTWEKFAMARTIRVEDTQGYSYMSQFAIYSTCFMKQAIKNSVCTVDQKACAQSWQNVVEYIQY